MSNWLSTELGGSANQTSAPVGYKPRATVYGARLKRLRGSFVFNTQTTSDVLVVGNLPAGATFAFALINTDTSTSTATLALGTASNSTKYSAAAAYTTTNTPTLVGKQAVEGAADPALTAEEQVIATIGTASLPASGNLTIDLFYSMPN